MHLADHGRGRQHVRQFPHMLFDLQRAVQSALQTVIGRELELDDEFPLVAVRHESHADPGRQISHRNEEKRSRQQHGRKPVAADEIDRTAELPLERAESAVPPPEQESQRVLLRQFGAQQDRRENRRQREAHEERHQRRNADRDRERHEEAADQRPIIAIGPNTTTFVMADAKTGRATSAAPLSAAVFGSSPRSRCLRYSR